MPTTPHDLTVCFADCDPRRRRGPRHADGDVPARGGGDPLFLDDRHQHGADSLRAAARTARERGGARGSLWRARRGRNPPIRSPRGGRRRSRRRSIRRARCESSPTPSGRPRRARPPRVGARLLVVSLRNARPTRANERAVKQVIDRAIRATISAPCPCSSRPRLPPPSMTRGGPPRRWSTVTCTKSSPHRCTEPRTTCAAAASPSAADRQHRRGGDARGQDAGAGHIPVGAHRGNLCSALLCRELGSRRHDGGRRWHQHRHRGPRRWRPVLRDAMDAAGVPVLQPSVELLSFGIGGGSIARVTGRTARGRARQRGRSAGARVLRPRRRVCPLPRTPGSCSAT